MILGIDAWNIRGGGAVTNLVNLLREVDHSMYGFTEVMVWSGKETLSRIDDQLWLKKIHEPFLDKNIFYRDDDHPSLKGSEMINDLVIKEIEKIELTAN